MSAIREGSNPHTQSSYTLGNRLVRAFWGWVYALFFRFSPTPLHGWRIFLLRLFGAKIGLGCRVYPRVRIWGPWNLEMGDYAAIGNDVDCYCIARIRLGARAVVSQKSYLCTGTHDYTHPGFQLVARPIDIGADAWVAADSFVGPGVNIGEGAVIGARSLVLKSMPAWTVCAGHPCKPIKPRTLRSE